ncbi:MAG: glycerate kinase [Lachnospiraceae bacterium]|jgi:glycerate kinase|nr:glycerate kinase [Lachnospiraceae bacterium]
MKKCAIVSGSFKDVYSPVEACEMIRQALPEGFEATMMPFCDGGEYTYDVLLNTRKYHEVYVDNILNPYFVRVNCRYLVYKDEAHIVSSEILRILPEEDDKKNPLVLTDFGLGQLIKHAIDGGFKHIFLYLGGTSTVSFGLGLAQAIGVNFYHKDGTKIEEPLTANDALDIIKYDKSDVNISMVDITIIGDGDAHSNEMRNISKLKISNQYEELKEEILDKLEQCRCAVLRLLDEDENIAFGGAAGGILFGIRMLFTPKCILGGAYFKDLLSAESIISDCDLVITGEGRYDNSACGKAPVFVSRLASKYKKKVYLVCGQVDRRMLFDEDTEIIFASDFPEMKENGIEAIITCQKYFNTISSDMDYESRIQYYREKTPLILKEIMRRVAL